MNRDPIVWHTEPPGLNLGETRASDADRDRVIQHLARQHATGRLSAEEYKARSEAALAAKTLPQLGQLYRDLPAIVVPGARARKPLTARNARTYRLLALSFLCGIAVLLVPGSVLISGHQANTPWWVVAGGYLSVCAGLVWTAVNIAWAIAVFD